MAENAGGARSNPSNIGRAPSLAKAVNYFGLVQKLGEWETNLELAPDLRTTAATLMQQAKLAAVRGDYTQATTLLQQLGQGIATSGPAMASWRRADALMLLNKWGRRFVLASQGKISPWVL